MALMLLDYLFDRDMQATSNLSGHGQHKKLQLDPLFIYGIKCNEDIYITFFHNKIRCNTLEYNCFSIAHVMHCFQTTEAEWDRIKLNIDSKCRAAFRRKKRGLPLYVKSFQSNVPSTNTDENPPEILIVDNVRRVHLTTHGFKSS